MLPADERDAAINRALWIIQYVEGSVKILGLLEQLLELAIDVLKAHRANQVPK